MQSPVSHRVRKLKRRSTSPIGTASTNGANHVCPASPITSRFDEELAKIIDYSDLSDTDDSQPDSGLSGSGSCSDERNIQPAQLIRPMLVEHLSSSSPSPLKLARRRRRLSPARAQGMAQECGFAPDTECSPTSSPVAARRLRKLTLFDSPRTPRSIVRHSRTPKSVSTTPHNDPGITINPFTPANRASQSKKSRVSMRAAATSRFRAEFIELSRLGQGEFGSVYRVVNRFDGCVYALKKTKRPIKGSQDENSAIKEVCAHAVLGKHKHVVRYYSAWCENDRMLIQSEYCNGGSLNDILHHRRTHQMAGFNRDETRELLRQMSSGLNYIHKKELAHLDIKPGNIFRSFNETVAVEANFIDGAMSNDDDEHSGTKVVYKIGDLGHVSSIDKKDAEEGDCRYAPRELICGNQNSRDLRSADIFALGITAYEAITLRELPKNGDQWHAIRENGVELSNADAIPDELVSLIAKMTSPKLNNRPLAHEVNEHAAVTSMLISNVKLQKLLQEAINKNKRLERELDDLHRGTAPKRLCIA